MLSVALCTYNGEKYLYQQLSSIFDQSNPIDEIIICDDNSIDTTLEIIKNFQNKFPSIIKLYQNYPSLGPIKNFEKAIGLCNGEIIFLSDQDDIWKKNKVESFSKKFQQSPFLEAIFSDGEMIDDQNKYLGKTLWSYLLFNKETQKKWFHGNALFQLINDDNKITGATLVIKKELFLRSLPFSLLKGVWHDVWLGLHAAANGTLGWIDEPLIQYRIHSNQQVGLGNGTTLFSDNKKVSLKELLIEAKRQYKASLFIVDKLSTTYPKINRERLQKKTIKELSWVNFRLNLPKNIFLRTFRIFKNISVYRNKKELIIRTIIRDIFNPAI